MDRIFLNVRTGKTIISALNGMMYESDVWRQVGTINTDEVVKTLSASERSTFSGRIKIS
jgi:hypothetical protein